MKNCQEMTQYVSSTSLARETEADDCQDQVVHRRDTRTRREAVSVKTQNSDINASHPVELFLQMSARQQKNLQGADIIINQHQGESKSQKRELTAELCTPRSQPVINRRFCQITVVPMEDSNEASPRPFPNTR